MLENYEGTAIDTSDIEEISPEPTETQTEEVVETVEPQTEEPAEDIATEEPTTPTEFDIPGVGKMTVDEISELRRAGLRQSDYTRKTQELARQREELAQATELFDYLKANPQLIEAMKQAEGNPDQRTLSYATPENEMLQKLAYQQKSLEIDLKLNDLKSKYGDVDEVALFKKATELGTEDLEFVYKGLKHDASNVDKKALIEEAKAELRAELEANRSAVSTVVSTTQTQPVQPETPLTAQQKRIAEGMGLSEDEYRKWM